MVSPVLTESRHGGGFLVSKSNATRSFGAFQISNAGGLPVLYQAGTVVSAALLATPVVTYAGTGNGSLGATLVLNAGALLGAYRLVATSANSFNVFDPNNSELAPATVGTAYTDSEIGFTITAGGTAFIAGDTFTVTIAAGTGILSPYTGASPAIGIMFNEMWVNPGDTVNVGVVVREAEINLSELVWAAGVTTPQQNAALAQLAALQIIAR